MTRCGIWMKKIKSRKKIFNSFFLLLLQHLCPVALSLSFSLSISLAYTSTHITYAALTAVAYKCKLLRVQKYTVCSDLRRIMAWNEEKNYCLNEFRCWFGGGAARIVYFYTFLFLFSFHFPFGLAFSYSAKSVQYMYLCFALESRHCLWDFYFIYFSHFCEEKKNFESCLKRWTN